jgi:hypothetical protein
VCESVMLSRRGGGSLYFTVVEEDHPLLGDTVAVLVIMSE